MLSERELRRPTFSEGSWVELGDGQQWCIPKSKIRFKPRLVDGKIELGGGPTFGPEFDETMDVLFGVSEADGAEVARAKFEIACKLLLANYDIPFDDLADLVAWEPDDQGSDDRWDAMASTIMGLPPKPSADTSAAPA